MILLDISKMFDQYINNKGFNNDSKFNYGFSFLNSKYQLKGSNENFIQNVCYEGGYAKASLLTSLSNEKAYRLAFESTCKNNSREINKFSIFWDSPHPTSYSHCWISYIIDKKIEDSGLIKKTSMSLNKYKKYCSKIIEFQSEFY